MAGENRRVAAQSAAHAQGLADNLIKQGFLVESQTSAQWILRKARRRGDHVVTIMLTRPSMLQDPAPPAPPPSGPPASTQWGPPTG